MRLMRRRQRRLGMDEAANWPRLSNDETPGRRVLLEASDPAEAVSFWRLMGEGGYEVSWCPGPSSSSCCVLVSDGHCPLLERADVVVTALNPEDAYDRPVLERLNEQQPMKPTVAVGNANRWRGQFKRFKFIDSFRIGQDLLPALNTANVWRARAEHPSPASGFWNKDVEAVLLSVRPR